VADCAKYKDLISSFADGELSDKEETEVRKHLDDCPVCQALLTACQSITEACEVSMEEPPEAFAGSVMERIRALPAETAPVAGAKKSRSVRPFIISFVAAAACLALVFIISPQLFSFGGSSKTASSAASSAVPAPMLQAQASQARDTGSAAAPKSPAAKSAGTAQAESAPNYAASSEQLMTGAAEAPDGAGSPASAGTGATDDSAAPEAGGQPDAAAAPVPSASAAPAASALDGDNAVHSDTAVNLEKYYAVISVKGLLPAILTNTAITRNSDGTESAEIPVETADRLIADGYPAVLGNSDALAALVLYTP
jgi:hypothetical protein